MLIFPIQHEVAKMAPDSIRV